MSRVETTKEPHLRNLEPRGYIEGFTISSKGTGVPLCRFYGGVRYGLPPSRRWARAHYLPETYNYGTKDQPGECYDGVNICPQPTVDGKIDDAGWSEDCFQCNVWVPIEVAPKNGTLANQVGFRSFLPSLAVVMTSTELIGASLTTLQGGRYSCISVRHITPLKPCLTRSLDSMKTSLQRRITEKYPLRRLR